MFKFHFALRFQSDIVVDKLQMINTNQAINFLHRQLESWPHAAANFDALGQLQTRTVAIDDFTFTLQHNPARIASTGAKVSTVEIKKRTCFLCAKNRPPVQNALPITLEGKPGEEPTHYELLVNPFPIFPIHFTIPAIEHMPQIISDNGARRFADMLRMALMLPGLAIFYNGAKCGASAPDHFHFQAVEESRMPLLDKCKTRLKLPFRVEYAEFSDLDRAAEWFNRLLPTLPKGDASTAEPPINIICAAEKSHVKICVIPRKAHRPDFYGLGVGEILVSPASVDLCGTIILPNPEDFTSKFTESYLRSLLKQTCY